MWSERKIGGFLIFVFSYVVLHFGLYDALVYYHHVLHLDKDWFKGTKDESLFDGIVLVDKLFGDRPIPVIPPTTRSLVGDLPPENPGEWPQWSMLHVLMDKAEHGEASYVAPYTLLLFGVYLPTVKFFAVIYWALGCRGNGQPNWGTLLNMVRQEEG